MSRFTKFASAAVLVASLAPFAAQASSGDRGTTAPANNNTAQTSQTNAGHDSAHANYANNGVPVSSHWCGGAATDSVGG